MANRRINRFGLAEEITNKLVAYGIETSRDLLNTHTFTLMVYLDLSLMDVQKIVHTVSNAVQPKPSTALMIYNERSQKARFLSTGIGKLDELMKGGLPIGCISEICGPPGIGKTQFCLNVALSCAVQNMLPIDSSKSNMMRNTGVLYIDTELKFDPTRLIQMAAITHPDIFSSAYRANAPHMCDDMLRNVIVSALYSLSLIFNAISIH